MQIFAIFGHKRLSIVVKQTESGNILLTLINQTGPLLLANQNTRMQCLQLIQPKSIKIHLFTIVGDAINPGLDPFLS